MARKRKKSTSATKPHKVKMDPPRLLGRSGGYVQDPRYALATDGRYTSDLTRSEAEHPPEPEAVDEATGAWIKEEADARFEILHAEERSRARLRSQLGRLRQVAIEQIRDGRDPSSILEAAIGDVERLRKAA